MCISFLWDYILNIFILPSDSYAEYRILGSKSLLHCLIAYSAASEKNEAWLLFPSGSYSDLYFILIVKFHSVFLDVGFCFTHL